VVELVTLPAAAGAAGMVGAGGTASAVAVIADGGGADGADGAAASVAAYKAPTSAVSDRQNETRGFMGRSACWTSAIRPMTARDNVAIWPAAKKFAENVKTEMRHDRDAATYACIRLIPRNLEAASGAKDAADIRIVSGDGGPLPVSLYFSRNID
jgi:hypothetical protein